MDFTMAASKAFAKILGLSSFKKTKSISFLRSPPNLSKCYRVKVTKENLKAETAEEALNMKYNKI